VKGHVLEKVLVVLLYDKSINAVAALETGTAIAYSLYFSLQAILLIFFVYKLFNV
jgi:hypothetical protein